MSSACATVVFQYRLKYGDVILSLIFQDCYSQTLDMTAKHLVFRKWSLREEKSLQRTLMMSTNLVKLSLPGKCDDKLLILIVANCLQTRLQMCLETGLQTKLQNGLFLFKIQLGTPQNIANEQLKH